MTLDMSPSRRRFLLGTGAAIGTAGLAGCGVPGGEEDDEEGDDEAEDDEQLEGPDEGAGGGEAETDQYRSAPD